MTLLAGDIGGTKTRLALFQTQDGRLQTLAEAEYPSADYADLDSIVVDFLRSRGDSPSAAAFGVAGPVAGRICRTTNLPWLVDAQRIEQVAGIPEAHLLNDLEATAWGLSAIPQEGLHSLQEGAPGARGNRAVIAAGTGLGQAGLFWDGHAHRPFATEGGHADFAPVSEEEFRLYRFLSKEHGHVSWERLVCGPGLVNIHRFLCADRLTPPPDWLAHEIAHADGAAAIARAADHGDAISLSTMDCFVRLYGREAGNVALKQMARGGLYIGGGIAPKILERLKTPAFLDAFLDKGRMRPLLEAMPVRVVLDDKAALYGPAMFLTARGGV